MIKTFIEDFKKFALRGNVLDLAVGVIIGAAFGKIVSSIVSDILMPIIGMLIGGFHFESLKFVMIPAVTVNGAIVKPEAALLYGKFLQNLMDFTIIAFSIFVIINVINKLSETVKKPEVVEEVKPPTTEELLTEIRDLLKAEQTKS